MCGSSGGNELTETPAMREEAKINAQLWNYYQTSYRPLIQKYSERVMDPETLAAEKRDVAGKINAEVMKNVTPGIASANPVETEKRLLGLAGAESRAQVQGEAGVRSRQIGETQNIINIGQGQAAEAQAGTSQLASESLALEEREQKRKLQESAQQQNMIGSLIGTGAGIGLGFAMTPRTITFNPDAPLGTGNIPGTQYGTGYWDWGK